MSTFANSLDSDQTRQNIGPDLYPNFFDTLMVFPERIFLGKVDFEKISTLQKSMEN